MNFTHLLAAFTAGVVASSFGTLIGGSSLITIPTLILLGLPPHTAIGTDRLGILGLATAGWYKFQQKGWMNYKIGFTMGVPTLLGSILGANLVLQINPFFLKKLVAILSISALVFLFATPHVGMEKASRPVTQLECLVGALLSLLVGTYGGFYGAMAGTFLIYVAVFSFRRTFLESAAITKVPSFLMTLTAGLVFALHGAVHYGFAITMFTGCFVGSYVGAHYSERIGNVWIKRFFIGIVLVMGAKLLLA